MSKAAVTAFPHVSIYVGENEIGRVSYSECVEILDWNIDETWASVQYKDLVGYVPKEHLHMIEEQKTESVQFNSLSDPSTFSRASGEELPYVVVQVTLKEKFFGTGSGNLTDLEGVLNLYYTRGYRLHTMSTATGNSTGGFGGDRIQATLVFEKINLFNQ